MEAMHEVSEGELNAIAWPRVIFSYTNKIEIPELANAETDPPENHQDNGYTPPVNTQPPRLQSLPEYTSFASAKPLPSPHTEAGDAAL